jgi:hypothetical protein
MVYKNYIAAALIGLASVSAVPSKASAADVAIAQNHVQGTIVEIVGKYDVRVKTARGDIADVTLRPGTIINPTGMTLRPGIAVTVLGSANANSFAATRIDTPFHAEASPVAHFGSYPGGTYGPFGIGDAGVFNSNAITVFVPNTPSKTTAASSSNESQTH